MSDSVPIEITSARMTESGLEITGKLPEGFEIPQPYYNVGGLSIYTQVPVERDEPFTFEETGDGRMLLYCANCLLRLELGETADPQQAVTIIKGNAVCDDHYQVELKNIKQGEN